MTDSGARGFVLILVLGTLALLVAALADRHARLLAAPPHQESVELDELRRASELEQVSEQEAAALLSVLAADSTVMLHLGLASPGLQTRTDGRSVLTAPWVLVCAEPVDNVRELLRPLGRSGDRPLTVAAPGFDEGTISTLLANLMAGTVQVQALVGPPEELRRLATLTGARLVTRAELQTDAVTAADHGHCAQLVADSDRAWVIGLAS